MSHHNNNWNTQDEIDLIRNIARGGRGSLKGLRRAYRDRVFWCGMDKDKIVAYLHKSIKRNEG